MSGDTLHIYLHFKSGQENKDFQLKRIASLQGVVEVV